MNTEDINSVCDYIIQRVGHAHAALNLLKLQKLLYYSQAWHLAFDGTPLFNGKFQAWVHGPVSRQIYDRFRSSKSLYSDVNLSDVSNDFAPKSISPGARAHVDAVLEVYMKYTGTQLEDMTHQEEPWRAARFGLPDSAACDRDIDEKLMQTFYAARLNQGN